MRRYRTLLFVLAAVGCEGGIHRLLEAPPPPYIRLSLALEPASLTVARGGELTFTATVTRTGEDRGPVTVSVDRPPAGVSAETRNASTSGTVTTVTVVVKAAVDAATGAYSLTVRGQASQATDGTSVLVLNVIDPPNYSLTLSKQSLTIARGGIAQLGIALARTNLPSPIALAVTGQAGIAGAFQPNPFSGDSTSATITVGADVAPGAYAVSVRGAVEGLSDRIVPLTVVVTADPIQVLAVPAVASPQLSTAATEVIVNAASVSGGVALSVEGLPPGVTASFDPLTAGNPATTLRLDIAGTTPAGNYPVTVRAKGSGAPDATSTLTLTVIPAAIGLTIVPPAANVFTGAATIATLAVSRSNFGGTVAFTADATPAGITVTFDSAAISGGAARATILASGAAPGTYPIVLRATPVGLAATAAQTGSVAITVVPAPTSGGNVVLDWSRCTAPEWVAVQDGAGPWTRVTGTGSVFGGAVSSPVGGVAWVENGTTTVVRYMTQSELTSGSVDMCGQESGKRVVHGVAVHGTTNELGTYQFGGATATSSAAQPAFTLTNVRDGVHDLLAYISFQTSTPTRIVLRRDISVGPGADSVGTINFQSQNPDAFAPITLSPGITVAGTVTAGETFSNSTSYLTTAACTANFLYASAPFTLSSGQLNFSLSTLGLPASVQRPDDYHLVTVLITSSDGFRSSSIAFHAAGLRSLSLAPAVSAPTVAVLPGPYKRLRATFGALPPAYNRAVALQYTDGRESMTVSGSPAYLAATGATLAMPDLADVSGWPSGAAIPATATGQWRFVVDGSTSPGTACVENRVSYSGVRTGVY